jgi:hypothetical protein
MKAIVTKEFKGLADGHDAERYFAEGETIHGELACQAVKDGNAAKVAGKAKAATKAKRK